MREQKFFICKICGNLVGMIDDAGVEIFCCGEEMTELKANTVDAAVEKHVPVAEVTGNTVKVTVGSTPHPMTKEHYIDFIYLLTEQGGQRKNTGEREAAVAEFALAEGDKPIAVYEYCNLHGLWKAEL